MKLNKEIELLFLLSRTEIDYANTKEKLSQKIDWNYFIDLTNRQGTSAIVYSNLLNFENVPHWVVYKLGSIYHNLLKRNILMISELDRILECLYKRGIEAIVLKGPLASESILHNIGFYPSDDIDILVKIEDVKEVIDFLVNDGYRINMKGFYEYKEFFINEQYHINLSKDYFTIEPHWNLFMRYYNAPREFWWEDSLIIQSNNKNYRILSPERNVLYLTFRFFNKGFRNLRFLLLINETVRYYRDVLDWERLFNYARKFSFESVLRTSLGMCKKIFSLQLPDEYLEVKKLRVNIIKKIINKMLLKEKEPHPINKLLFIFLRDDIVGIFKVILRRVFPSRGEIVLRYGLNPFSYKVYLYYVFNPLLILLRKHEK